MMRRSEFRDIASWRLGVTVWLLLGAVMLAQDQVMLFDFRHKQTNGWFGNSQVARVEPREEGLYAESNGGPDPWIEGPAITSMPEGDYEKIRLELCFKATAPEVQMFFGARFRAGASCYFANPRAGTWTTVSVVMPRFEPGARLRIDPCVYDGNIVVATIKAQPLKKCHVMSFAPAAPIKGADVELQSGTLTLKHHPRMWDAYTVSNGGKLLAQSYDKPRFVAQVDGKAVAVELSQVPVQQEKRNGELTVTAAFRTGRIGWTARRVFRVTPNNGMQVETAFTPDADAEVLQAPLVTLFPGMGSYGEHKTQGLFAGVEYLLDEPSSSELDVKGPTANRLFVDNYKTCFPLMAITFGEQWLSLSWDFYRKPGMLFDSPDRQFHSGGHLFALIMPGPAQGMLENDFNVYKPLSLKAGEALSLTSEIATGTGDGTMAAPVEDYLRRHPLPELPVYPGGYQAALSLAAVGWLDSVIRTDLTWRHAWVPNDHYGARQKGDVIVLLDYIRCRTTDQALAERVRGVLEQAKAELKQPAWGASASHNWPNIYNYMYLGETKKWLESRRRAGVAQCASIRADGSYPFRRNPDKPDYGSTHWTDHANGLTATSVQNAAEFALVTGDEAYRKTCLQVIDKVLALYHHDIPRGAQTWEIPLHAPDIVGAAYMMNLALAAYRLTGKDSYLQEVEYWALTGIPFVYLVTPEPSISDDGLYGTLAVLGSTFFDKHLWIGNPVQWCGAVYRNSLYNYVDELRDADKAAFWKKIADGITIMGLRFCWQESNSVIKQQWGLLPDGWYPQTLGRTSPAVNPGTLQTTMPRAYGEMAIGSRKVVKTGLLVHALGDVSVRSESSVELALWPTQPTQVVISGLAKAPRCRWNGRAVASEWVEGEKVAIVNLQGKGVLEWQ